MRMVITYYIQLSLAYMYLILDYIKGKIND